MIRALTEGMVVAVAATVVFTLGDQYGARRERRKAEADRARAVTYGQGSKP